MSQTRAQIEAAIAALQAQRAILGDAIVATALAPLQDRLAALLAPTEEPRRRQVTVLIADVAGSTALVRELDPEDTQALLDDAFERFTSLIRTHRGRVLQYAGDSVLAVFGGDE
jgi:class 3 adenylate cyclase